MSTVTSFISARPSGLQILTPARLTTFQIPIQSQYHAQDELGQYSYGYNSPLSAKNEIRTADGITRGGYAYLDANGLLQNVQYTADSLNGFRVAASNLPQPPVANLVPPAPVEDTPEVAQAKLNHLRAIQQNLNEITTAIASSPAAPTVVPAVQVALQPAGLRLAYPTLGYNSLLLPSVSSQYHTQQDNGQYAYGYANQVGVGRPLILESRELLPNYLGLSGLDPTAVPVERQSTVAAQIDSAASENNQRSSSD